MTTATFSSVISNSLFDFSASSDPTANVPPSITEPGYTFPDPTFNLPPSAPDTGFDFTFPDYVLGLTDPTLTLNPFPQLSLDNPATTAHSEPVLLLLRSNQQLDPSGPPRVHTSIERPLHTSPTYSLPPVEQPPAPSMSQICSLPRAEQPPAQEDPLPSLHLRKHIDNTTWASRNPTRPALLPRPVLAAPLTDAQKASRDIVRKKKKADALELHESIKEYLATQELQIAELAKKHNVSNEKAKELVGAYSHYKKTRKPTLHNAMLHVKAAEVNQGSFA